MTAIILKFRAPVLSSQNFYIRFIIFTPYLGKVTQHFILVQISSKYLQNSLRTSCSLYLLFSFNLRFAFLNVIFY